MTPTTDTKIVEEDWALDDLTGRELNAVEFVRVDMAETTSTGGTVFDGCVFRDVGFDLAEYTAAAFMNCQFASCSFVGARFAQCKFVGSTFERCRFDRLTVDGGDWSFVALRRADLKRASFDGVRMQEADVSGADATDGVLRELDLARANFHNAVLDRCDLRGSDLSALDPWNVSLRGAKITWEQAVVLAVGFGLDVQ